MNLPAVLRRCRNHAASCAILAASALLIGVGWAITLERIAYERVETERAAFREVSNLALAFEQDVVRTLNGLDQAMRFVQHEFEDEGSSADLRGALSEMAIRDAPRATVSVVNEDGVVVATTGTAIPDLSDRAWFRFHKEHPSSALHVWPPLQGRISGQPTIPVTRRIDKPDGTFGGAVITGVAPSYLTGFFERIDVGAAGSIQLVGLDGVVRARRTGNVTKWGSDLSGSNLIRRAASRASDTFISAGRLDGIPRYTSYRRLADLPLVVSVGVSVDEAMAPFMARQRNYYLGAGAATFGVALFAAVLLALSHRQRRAREERRRLDASYRTTFESAPVGIAHHAMDGRFLKANPAFTRMIGYTEDELRERTFLDILHPEDAPAARANLERRLPAPLKTENRHLRKDGTEIWAAVAVSVVPDAAGAPEYFIAMVEDITERKVAERKLAESRKRFRDLVDNSSDFIWELDAGLRFTYASESLRKLLGHDPAAVLGKTPADLMPAEHRELAQARSAEVLALQRAFAGFEHPIFDVQGIRHIWEASGVPIFGADGSFRGFRGISRDVTARKRAEAQLRREAHYDRLTGLPNRILCFDRLEQSIAQSRRQQAHTALMLLDADRFKTINDTLGPLTGDAVLAAIAKRLAGCVRAGDTVARIGGDEFAIVLHPLQRPEDARLVAKKILDAMALPVQVGGQEVYVTLSIGIAVCPPDGERPEVLSRNADAALLRAKKSGRNLFQFYTAEMNARVADQVALERDLRRALERKEFALQYQPKSDLRSGQVVGFEALLRWNRAGNGMVPPAQFIPVLEESGLIREVGAWVLREACRQVRAWIDEGLRPLPVAVNISAKQFQGDLHGIVEGALRESGLDAAMLKVEITESDAMQDPDRAVEVLHRLAALGVGWSIDDFGTGYSSLSYLKRFRPGELKLDRSFVQGLPRDPDDVSITNAVISMAHSLGMKVVAEGVETEAQRRFLQSRGCDQMQGFLLSKPLPAAACRDFLMPAPQQALL